MNGMKAQNICKQDQPKVLLVEGINDCHVVLALCNFYQIPETFGIYECGSDIGVLKRLNALITRSDTPEVIGVVLDVDNSSIESRWQSVIDKLKDYKDDYQFPSIPNTSGTIVDSISDKPKLGFWFMPNNNDSGMLEDFCAKLAEPNSLQFVKECLKQAKEKELAKFKDVHYSKAVIHTYLAWQDEPGYPLGKAITSQVLQPNTNNAELFTTWLKLLFT